MPNKPHITLKGLKDLHKNLMIIPVSPKHGRCVPLLESQKMVREWITSIEHEQQTKNRKKVQKERLERERADKKQKKQAKEEKARLEKERQDAQTVSP